MIQSSKYSMTVSCIIIGVIKVKKVIALLMASFMLMSVIVVSATGLSAEQQADLYFYGIMVGDENGDLRLKDAVTKAEVVKMICCAGKFDVNSNSSFSENTLFNDVPEDHWAYRYINIAKTVGLVDGDENGNFKPEDEITYDEIIKMIVAVLGYSHTANAMGGYPDGYAMVATQLGLTKLLSIKNESVATRSDVAILVSNALDIPIMVQSGIDFSTQQPKVEYQVLNGDNGTKLRTLRSILNETE